jgi:lysophospholipase L1-like esterase
VNFFAARDRGRLGITTLLAAVAAVATMVAVLVFGGVVSPPQSASATENTAAKRSLVVFVGNSFTSGSAMDSSGVARYPSLLSARLGFPYMTLTAEGAGYAAAGSQSRTFVTLAKKVPRNAAVVVVLGSSDDVGHTAADIRAGAASTYARIHKQAPDAVILAVASPWGERPAPRGIVTARDAVRDAALQDGDAFVDPIADNWWVAGPSGAVGQDGVHPTDTGHAEIAEYLAPKLAMLLGRSS